MNLLTVGVSHRTAPVPVLERLVSHGQRSIDTAAKLLGRRFDS